MTFTGQDERMSRRIGFLILVVGLPAILAASCQPPNPPPSCVSTGTGSYRNLRFGASPGVSANLQSLDLYVPVRPAGCPSVPVVAYVHGGGFINGDKANQLASKIDLFAREGWAFASLNYRLVGDPGAGPTNGVYPAAEQDVAAGIKYLAAHAAAYNIDAKRMMLLGHSAGAHLVALVSTDGSLLQGVGLTLDDVDCTAPLDTTYDIPHQIAGGGQNELMYRNAFGNDPAIWVKGSPSRNVAPGKGIPSFHIVTRGAPGRVAESQAFGTSLRNAGVPADVQVAAGLDHEGVNDAVGRVGDTVITPPLMSFYRNCIK
jgi:acetyl esterase/lipase